MHKNFSFIRSSHITPTLFFLAAMLLSAPNQTQAAQTQNNSVEPTTQTIEYKSGQANLEGFLATPKAPSTKKLSAMLIVHDWMGIGEFTKNKAKLLASQGFVAMAVDVYGKDNLPKNSDEAAKLSGKLKEDRALLRSRIRAAYDVVAKNANVDRSKIFVMGYCFGGTTALELARSGAELRGTISFHGGLSTPTPQDAKQIKGPVLALHGADDPYVSTAEVEAFKKEMKDANVSLQFISYPGAVHAFTNPAAGDDPKKGAAYQKAADEKSWIDFNEFMKNKI